ncbi:hypothetical protein [Phormidium tenue]|uniref:Uncharacterized protein n=2 Tax=Phormidium tenue TaxID=126344 RepID=A0A1U7J151_9CYAN|nr:hypothetical protein [Phormidium tenue]MBD2233982.1 hypothetical protein [Phormidium tenue FACHB-1052]OKH45409.1 hypothetical protein NIES30_19990 [Phormidium tenue NIES-30]
MTRLACAASLGLVMATAVPLGSTTGLETSSGASLRAVARTEDDRGSGRLSRMPAIAGWLSFRGSGRVDPTPPQPSFSLENPVAYRGSGRITKARTT